jgi:hypothetical protein
METLTRDSLIAGAFPNVTGSVTLASGNLARGSVLGKITIGAASKAAKSGGNTGGGTCVLDVTTPILAGAKAGVYKVRVIRAAVAAPGTTPAVAAMLAIGELRDPSGNVLEVFDILGSGGTAVQNQVKFVIAESGTAFIVGDGFDITLAAGSGSYKLVDSTAIDGSDAPRCILVDAADASGGAKTIDVYQTGEFNEDALIFGGSDTHDTHRTALRALGIFLKDTLEA